MIGVHAPRTKTCEVCHKPFILQRMGQKVCGIVCARKHVKAQKAKGRQELRERKKAIRKLSECRAAAQKAFNAWIRARDADLPCVSCGETNPPMLPGGQWDAGHFLSRGAYPELAFEPLNVWKQCQVMQTPVAGSIRTRLGRWRRTTRKNCFAGSARKSWRG